MALSGALAAAGLAPTAASAAPSPIPKDLMGSQNGVLAFSTTQGPGTVWVDGSRRSPIKIGGATVDGHVSAWSADGNRVLLTATGNASVRDVNPWTATLAETLTDPDGRQIQGPSVSPDGLTYAWGTPGSGFRVGTSESATTWMPHQSAGTAWASTDRLLWINDDRDPGEITDDPGVYAADNASEPPPRNMHLAFLTDEDHAEYPTQVSVSADGTKLAYSTFDTQTSSDAIRVSSAENGSDSRFLETGGAPGSDDRYGVVSPDGTKVAFASNRGGAWAIYTAGWDGTGVAVVPNTTLPSGQSYTGLAWQPSQAPDLYDSEISSATEVGSTLSLDHIGQEIGTAPLTTTYKWQRCDDGTTFSCADTGVTTETYPVTDADVGHRYRVVRTVSNPAGTDTLASEITTAIVQPTPADTEPPAAPTLTTKPAARSNATTPTFAWTAAEAGGTFTCSLDHAAFTSCATGQAILVSGDGPHSFSVRQTDDAQNPGAIAEHTWTLDTAKPSVPTIGSKPPAVTPSSTARVTFSGDEADAGFECRFGADGASWGACSSPADLTGLTDGDKRFSIRQVDAAGNASDPAVVTWTVDRAAPAQPTVTTDLSDVRTTSTVDVAFAGEPGGTFACSIDGGAFAPCVSPVRLEGLTTGSHRFAVRQTDAAGNEGQPREVPFEVDVTGPAKPTITAGPDAFVSTPRVAFAFTGAEADGRGFECAIDGVRGWSACESGVDVDGLPEGPHTFRVRQLDAHGTPGETASATWTYDATKPTKPTLTGDLGDVRTKETQLVFRGEGPEGEGTFECRLDADPWQPCASPAVFGSYASGPHTVAVREIDRAGNVGEAAEDAFVADFRGPAAPQVTARPDTRTEKTTATVDGTLADPHGTVEYALDDGRWTTTTLPLTLTDLAVGDHVLLVRQTDDAGNHGEPARIAWTIVAPATTPAPVETPAPGPAPEHPAAPQHPAAPEHPAAPAQAPAPAATKPAATEPAPADKPKLTAVVGSTGRGSGSAGTASAATITVRRDGVGVGCAITGTVLTSCRVDLYAAAPTGGPGRATSRAARTAPRRVLVGTGIYRAQAGSTKMDVDVTLNATGRAMLRSAPEGLKVAVRITGRPATGAALKATGVATLVAQRTSAVVGGFAVDSPELTPAAKRQLTQLAARIRGTAKALRIVGHTDGAPNDADYLKRLGLRRAQVVAAFLRAHGVRARATVLSQGATRPRATNRTEAGRALNRRVELRVDR